MLPSHSVNPPGIQPLSGPQIVSQVVTSSSGTVLFGDIVIRGLSVIVSSLQSGALITANYVQLSGTLTLQLPASIDGDVDLVLFSADRIDGSFDSVLILGPSSTTCPWDSDIHQTSTTMVLSVTRCITTSSPALATFR